MRRILFILFVIPTLSFGNCDWYPGQVEAQVNIAGFLTGGSFSYATVSQSAYFLASIGGPFCVSGGGCYKYAQEWCGGPVANVLTITIVDSRGNALSPDEVRDMFSSCDDSDGDGFDDLEELFAGTDPLDPEHHPEPEDPEPEDPEPEDPDPENPDPDADWDGDGAFANGAYNANEYTVLQVDAQNKVAIVQHEDGSVAVLFVNDSGDIGWGQPIGDNWQQGVNGATWTGGGGSGLSGVIGDDLVGFILDSEKTQGLWSPDVSAWPEDYQTEVDFPAVPVLNGGNGGSGTGVSSSDPFKPSMNWPSGGSGGTSGGGSGSGSGSGSSESSLSANDIATSVYSGTMAALDGQSVFLGGMPGGSFGATSNFFGGVDSDIKEYGEESNIFKDSAEQAFKNTFKWPSSIGIGRSETFQFRMPRDKISSDFGLPDAVALSISDYGNVASAIRLALLAGLIIIFVMCCLKIWRYAFS